MSELIKHAEFAAALHDQGLVLKHEGAPCPARIDVSGSTLDGAMLSIDLVLLKGSKIQAAKLQRTSEKDTVNASIFLSAKSILATRGSKTDSFARVLLVADNDAEHEIGRTETIVDDLSPEYALWDPTP